MADRHPDGYIRIARQPIGYRDPDRRTGDSAEIYRERWEPSGLRDQGERCMDCGVPCCMAGCPLGNLIPDWNHLVARERWREALYRLHATNNFPEFTGYTCPAPCEPACTLAISNEAVAIKSIERAIVDVGWQQGWIVPEPPHQRTNYKVAVVGSGPAGLAAAQQLNRVGHRVTVYERDDAPGGLMTYGIPDFKFAKHRIHRRIKQLRAEGIEFRNRVEVGVDLPLDALRRSYHAVSLCIGGQLARDLDLPGRHLEGIVPGMRYLVAENRHQAGQRDVQRIDARGRRVVVMGGGDTGADCVATAIRQGAVSVTQLDINTKRPAARPLDNPWPAPPVTFQGTYAQQEGCADVYGFEAAEFFSDGNGRVQSIGGQEVSWTYSPSRRRLRKTILEAVSIPAELVLLAIGFQGAEVAPFATDGLAISESGTIALNKSMQTSLAGVFAAGDANMGQSLVVWAIAEGRDVARAVDTYLQGDSNLPVSLRSRNAIDWGGG